MAAVPDLTGYSNEATYARDVLTDGASNEVAGALGSGYLLSDDPYGNQVGHRHPKCGPPALRPRRQRRTPRRDRPADPRPATQLHCVRGSARSRHLADLRRCHRIRLPDRWIRGGHRQPRPGRRHRHDIRRSQRPERRHARRRVDQGRLPGPAEQRRTRHRLAERPLRLRGAAARSAPRLRSTTPTTNSSSRRTSPRRTSTGRCSSPWVVTPA